MAYRSLTIARQFIFHSKVCRKCRDENGSNTDGYHRYHICFHISDRIRIQIRIISILSDKVGLDVDIVNIRFKYSDTDKVSNVEYSESDTDRSESLYTNSVLNTVGKYLYRFHPYASVANEFGGKVFGVATD